jgi:cytochrome d ubiquinol oxidase subunit II
VGTFFTGSRFSLNMFNSVTWGTPYHGLEAAFNVFNLSFGLFLVFLARTLGAMYIVNHVDHENLVKRARKATWINLLLALPFLLVILISLVTMDGFAVDPITGKILVEKGKYLHNLLGMPVVLALLLGGLVSVIYGVVATGFLGKTCGIWFGGLGTVFVGLAIFSLAGYNNTAFYPSLTDLQSSLTIYNASSSKYTLKVMSYVAIAVPFVLGYVAYVWKVMDSKKLTLEELVGEDANEMY